MRQQSSSMRQPEQSSTQLSFLKKYLPAQERSLLDSKSQDPSVVFTPQNYMLMLSYSTSLQKENQELRNELAQAKKQLNQYQKKCKKLQTNSRLESSTKKGQPYIFSSFSIHSNRSSVELAPSMFSKNKLAPMTERSLSTKAVRQYEYQHEDNDSDEFEHLDKLIMSELKADNERMAKKIQQLYCQQEKIIQRQKQKHQCTQKQDVNKQNHPFENIKLNQNIQKQAKRHHKHEKKRVSTQSVDEIPQFAPNLYTSEPCSFEISFQVPPSFKSMKQLPQHSQSSMQRWRQHYE